MTTTRYLSNVFFQALSEAYSAVSKQRRYVGISHEKSDDKLSSISERSWTDVLSTLNPI